MVALDNVKDCLGKTQLTFVTHVGVTHAEVCEKEKEEAGLAAIQQEQKLYL